MILLGDNIVAKQSITFSFIHCKTTGNGTRLTIEKVLEIATVNVFANAIAIAITITITIECF